ncbi:MAG: LD-carboxypeptidase [SAR324 cluster bacterium]|nr:LD-carboxypeptidase [SAR324 cluster bacterium]
MTAPLKLKPGDAVALIAPSSHQTKEKQHLIAEAVAVLESWGLYVHLQPSYENRYFYLAGEDSYRLEQFEKFYTNPQIKALFVTRGGYGASRFLSGLNSELVANHQKIVVGLSDATSLLLYLQKVSSAVLFHGPNLATSQFLESPQKAQTQQSLREHLFHADHYPAHAIQTLHSGTAQGFLTGGCLSLVVASLGTFYEIETDGKILFLEDVQEDSYRIDRMLTHLRNAGKLDQLKGLVFGEMVGCHGTDGLLWEMLVDFFKNDPFPVAFGLPSGHGEISLTLPLGTLVELNTTADSLVFLPS